MKRSCISDDFTFSKWTERAACNSSPVALQIMLESFQPGRRHTERRNDYTHGHYVFEEQTYLLRTSLGHT